MTLKRRQPPSVPGLQTVKMRKLIITSFNDPFSYLFSRLDSTSDAFMAAEGRTSRAQRGSQALSSQASSQAPTSQTSSVASTPQPRSQAPSSQAGSQGLNSQSRSQGPSSRALSLALSSQPRPQALSSWARNQVSVFVLSLH